MRKLNGAEILAEMAAFEYATRAAYGHTPDRHPVDVIRFDWERAYMSDADSRRFAGWCMRAAIASVPRGEPRNGEDLLNHCRNYEQWLVAMLAHENAIAKMRGDRPLETTHAIEMLRDSIRTAEEGMKS